jgi:IS4 transposase
MKARCTGSKNRWVTRHFYEAAYARSELRLVQQPELMNERKKVERPFAILKQVMGIRRFQSRGKEVVRAEIGLAVLSYNLKRLINRVGTRNLLNAFG